MANKKIRKAAAKNGVKLWEVGRRFGVHESTFCKWLRDEFPPEKTKDALRYIDEIAFDKKQGG